MDVFLAWFFGPMLVGPLLLFAGVLCIRFTIRRLRAKTHTLSAVISGMAGVIMILIGLSLVAYLALMLLYAWTHNPPGY